MNIADKVEKALANVIKLYADVPEFGRDPPEKYAIYTIAETPADFSEGENRVNQYYISVNVFTPQYDFDLYEQIKSAMYREGLCYAEGGNVADDKLYPFTRHYYLDFIGVEER
ncbi:MAG: hypothetical protein HDT42_06260 [Ruminococcaceae bacterium]|nr:hypothetical protein [Oscillospiraceae bacterium]